jgi:soluble cytochrome b562
MKRLFLYPLTIGLLVLSGCAQPPTAELNAAQKAIEDARTAQADKYAAGEFGAAQKALTDATAEISNQDKRFVLTRNYTTVKNLLKDVETKAQVAQTASRENTEKTKSEVEALIQDTTASLEATKVALEKAPKGKDTAADLAALKADLDALTTKIDQAKALANNGDYLEAKASLTETKQKAADIATQLQQVAEKVRGKRAS